MLRSAIAIGFALLFAGEAAAQYRGGIRHQPYHHYRQQIIMSPYGYGGLYSPSTQGYYSPYTQGLYGSPYTQGLYSPYVNPYMQQYVQPQQQVQPGVCPTCGQAIQQAAPQIQAAPQTQPQPLTAPKAETAPAAKPSDPVPQAKVDEGRLKITLRGGDGKVIDEKIVVGVPAPANGGPPSLPPQ